MSQGDEDGVRAIIDRLNMRPANPVTRARAMVEREVPPERRGPGWDRHWRELEAYLEAPGDWTLQADGGAKDDGAKDGGAKDGQRDERA